MANPRHEHEYRCFAGKNFPSDMVLMAGVIDTTTNYVEHPEVVADRLEGGGERDRRSGADYRGDRLRL